MRLHVVASRNLKSMLMSPILVYGLYMACCGEFQTWVHHMMIFSLVCITSRYVVAFFTLLCSFWFHLWAWKHHSSAYQWNHHSCICMHCQPNSWPGSNTVAVWKDVIWIWKWNGTCMVWHRSGTPSSDGDLGVITVQPSDPGTSIVVLESVNNGHESLYSCVAEFSNGTRLTWLTMVGHYQTNESGSSVFKLGFSTAWH